MNADSTKAKAVGLLSGGLDSVVAAKLVKECGLDVYGVFFSMPWGCGDENRAAACAKAIGIPLHIIELDEDYLDLLKNPKYGYGSAFNPCIDCHAYMIRKAEAYRQQIGASFIFTGEVLGQRPMSQTKISLKKVEQSSGIEGYLLRPLSALLLDETIPEKEKIIDRQRLRGFSGRSRRNQLDLAQKWGIQTFKQPAGGCLLTDYHFGNRIKDLMQYGYRHPEDTICLKWGRHFRINEKFKIILGRDEAENNHLTHFAHPDDIIMLLDHDVSGPLLILQGTDPDPELLTLCAGLIQFFSKFKDHDPLRVIGWQKKQASRVFYTTPQKLTEEFIDKIKI